MVRKHYQQQQRFDNSPIANVELNLECRDEIVPNLFGLRQLYNDTKLRRKAVQLIAADLNEKSRRDVGRPGMDDWHVVVLAPGLFDGEVIKSKASRIDRLSFYD